MPTLCSQQQLRRAQRLPFCYLCGAPLIPPTSRDHVPPKSIFSQADRQTPLILRTHSACNQQQSARDRVIGQLVAVSWRRYPAPHDRAFTLAVFDPSVAPPRAGISGINLSSTIGRWLKAFHAALYEHALPRDTPNKIYPPLPEGRVTEGGLVFDAVEPAHRGLVWIIKRNRAAKRLDRIVCYNGKCTYECTWEFVEGEWRCVFALQIYNWRELGDPRARRGCVGAYKPQAGLPEHATQAIHNGERVEFSNADPTDPFGP